MASIERCVVFFQVESLDLHFATTFLYRNRMFSSFMYVYSVGLHEFIEAFQIVFYCLPPDCSFSDLDDVDVGYKLLLFLYYTFDFKLFPRAQASDLIGVSTVLRLMTLLASAQLVPLTHLLTDDRHRSKSDDVYYPYLTALCRVDAMGCFEVLTRGFAVLQGNPSSNSSSDGGDTGDRERRMTHSMSSSQVAVLYDNMLRFAIFANEKKLVDDDLVSIFYSNLEPLIAEFRGSLSSQFLESYITFYASQPLSCRHTYENQLSRLMRQQVSGSTLSHPVAIRLHRILVSHSFFIAGLSIQTTSTLDYSAVDVFEQAMAFYISMAREEPSELARDTNDGPYLSIFKYIDAQFEFIEACVSHTQHYNVKAFFINEVIKSLAQLGSIDLKCCSTVVHKHLSNHVSSIIEYTATDPFIQFSLLDDLVTKSRDNTVSPQTDAALVAELFSMEDLLTYFSLLCHCQPARVLPFLKQFENYYPVDNYLAVCRQKGLSEAVSFLMEKLGEVLEALHVLLRDLSQRLKTARRDIDLLLRAELTAQSVRTKEKFTPQPRSLSISLILTKQGVARSELVTRLPCYKEIQALMFCIVELCSRHGEALHSSMWLTAFDHLLLERREYMSNSP